MKKILFLAIYLLFSVGQAFSAQVIENIQKEDRVFGDWTVSCEEDIMMEKVSCKIFTTFLNGSSSIYVQPQNKVANQVVVMIPSIAEKTSVKIRIDKNPLIVSNTIEKRAEYGVIPFYPADQQKLLNEMKPGKDLYIRFAISDPKSQSGAREITVKISLMDFIKMLDYYETRVNNKR